LSGEAGVKQDLSICDKIQDQEIKIECYAYIAKIKNDLSICDKMQDKKEKEECYLRFELIAF